MMKASQHVPALDGVRGIAILAVVLHNTVEATAASSGGIGTRFLLMLAGPAWIGVQLFFALSGFLIAGELLDNRTATNYLSAFYARRALRILPLYYLVLAVLLLALPAARIAPTGLQSVGSDQWRLWCFVVNFGPPPPNGFAHFWSLAVEAQFYLFAPWALRRLSAARLFTLAIWTAGAVLVLRTTFALLGVNFWTLYTGTLFRLDAFALGAAGACVVRSEPLLRSFREHFTVAATVTFLLVVAGAALSDSYDFGTLACESYGYSVLALGCGFLVTAAAAAQTGVRMPVGWTLGLRTGLLRACGKYSFGIYVFHELLNRLAGVTWFRSHFGLSPPAGAVIAYSTAILAVSSLLAVCSFHLLEHPMLRRKPAYRRPPI